ncbi:hypothetical protein D6764_00820 [Candidatus Woesearchaeota archaeon]|nr:MAG: hypothetical protein D6764_00820 [Candidatus Woesearchaeota archaeon]
MHTPDGFITSWVCVAMILFSLGFLARAVAVVRKSMTKKKMLEMSAAASVIFALQMLNFPVTNGTSGHFIGAAFSAFLFGPEAALIVLASVIVVQSLVYGDGGILAIGVNTFNMAVVGVYAAHYARKAGIFAGSVASVIASALSAAFFIGISGTIKLSLVVPAMLKAHIPIALGEALITVAAVPLWNALMKSNPDLLSSAKKAVLFSLALCSFLLIVFVPVASSSPDGLESVAMQLGFFEKAVSISPSPLAGYTFMGAASTIAVVASGLVGVLLSFGLSYSMSIGRVKQ